MENATYLVLLLAMLAFGYRIVIGPTLADRTLAISGGLVVGMVGIATHAAYTDTGAFLPILVVIGLVGFVSTAIIARYIEGGGR
ncbi:MAG TPA: monovalent cation/H+ antiporter complex subunit F [Acidimicrobiales bacterium]